MCRSLGNGNKEITAAQISTSSQYDGSHAPNQGRLHFKDGQGAWAAGANNPNQWFQIELRVEANVTFVATQGRFGSSGQRVTQYKLQYSKGGLSFQVYKQNGENSDKVRGIYFIRQSKSRNTDRQSTNHCRASDLGWAVNRPFPSSPVPLFQSESKYETIFCIKMKLHAKLIFI